MGVSTTRAPIGSKSRRRRLVSQQFCASSSVLCVVCVLRECKVCVCCVVIFASECRVCCALCFCTTAKCVVRCVFFCTTAQCVVRFVFERVQSVCVCVCVLCVVLLARVQGVSNARVQSALCLVFVSHECNVCCACFFHECTRVRFCFLHEGNKRLFFFLRVRFSPIAQHWGMRTSFEPQSVSSRLKSSEWLVARGFCVQEEAGFVTGRSLAKNFYVITQHHCAVHFDKDTSESDLTCTPIQVHCAHRYFSWAH